MLTPFLKERRWRSIVLRAAKDHVSFGSAHLALRDRRLLFKHNRRLGDASGIAQLPVEALISSKLCYSAAAPRI